MVVFLCAGCNETLKKSAVDKHASGCRSCWAVTCLDCNTNFEGDDFRAHTVCVSEAEKYEKTLYKGGKDKKKGSANPQDAWMDLVREAAAAAASAPPAIRGPLSRMAELSNVPRNEKKFCNFISNSLNLRDQRVISQIWSHLAALREERTPKAKPSNQEDTATAKEPQNGASSREVESSGSEALQNGASDAKPAAGDSGLEDAQASDGAAAKSSKKRTRADAADGEEERKQRPKKPKKAGTGEVDIIKLARKLLKKAGGQMQLKQLQKEVLAQLGDGADKRRVKKELKAFMREEKSEGAE